MSTPHTIEWVGGADGFVRLIDQTLLPTTLAFLDCRTPGQVWEAIRSLRVRGAPAIGVAAALGTVLGVQGHTDPGTYRGRLHEVTAYLRTSRPTAVNLFWALERMERRLEQEMAASSSARPEVAEGWTRRLLDEALAIEEEDRAMCRAI